ncbi:MAG: transcriptional repressor [Rubrobacteridae bacterium]|nr:transcriptional repressor [Rubrobacteridae bacterium]
MRYYPEIIESLKAKGCRITKLRRFMVKELDEAGKPLSVSEIMFLLKAHDMSPHKTSVYREIAFLVENGIIERITYGEKLDRFKLTALGHHHHAVCENCGEVRHVVCGEGIKEIERMLEEQHFKVHHHLVEFIGLCEKCR